MDCPNCGGERPNLQGFYIKYWGPKPGPISQSAEALVFYLARRKELYRVDRMWNAVYRVVADDIQGVAQSSGSVLLLIRERGEECDRLFLNTCDSRLKPLSWTFLGEIPKAPRRAVLGMNEHYSLLAMNERYAFALAFTHPRRWELGVPTTDLVVTRWDLETSEKRQWNVGRIGGDDAVAEPFSCNPPLSDGPNLYLPFDLDGADNILMLDTDHEIVTRLWTGPDLRIDKKADPYGFPRFFDFARDVMWTFPTREECQRHGWDSTSALVARRIAPGAPMLPDWEPWVGSVLDAFALGPDCNFGLAYFDGERCFYSNGEELLSVADRGAKVSPVWISPYLDKCHPGVVFFPWQGKLIVDVYDEADPVPPAVYPFGSAPGKGGEPRELNAVQVEP